LAFFLEVTPEVAAARGGGYGEEKYETRQIQERARALFAEVVNSDWIRVDAGMSVEQVENQMLKYAVEMVGEVASGKRGELNAVEATG
jgi:dTMP kinase